MLNQLRAHPNVVRFPAEQRVKPSLELLGDITPNADLIGLLIEGTDLETSITEVRDDADRETAERIMNAVDPVPGPRRRRALDVMLDSILSRRSRPAAARTPPGPNTRPQNAATT